MSRMKQFKSCLVAAAIVMMTATAWAEDARIAVAAEAPMQKLPLAQWPRERHIS